MFDFGCVCEPATGHVVQPFWRTSSGWLPRHGGDGDERFQALTLAASQRSSEPAGQKCGSSQTTSECCPDQQHQLGFSCRATPSQIGSGECDILGTAQCDILGTAQCDVLGTAQRDVLGAAFCSTSFCSTSFRVSKPFDEERRASQKTSECCSNHKHQLCSNCGTSASTVSGDQSVSSCCCTIALLCDAQPTPSEPRRRWARVCNCCWHSQTQIFSTTPYTPISFEVRFIWHESLVT